MANGGQKRTRSQRVASIELPPNLWERTLTYLQRGSVLLRIGLAAIAAVMLWALTSGWAPHFPYRAGYIPARDITAKVAFKRPDLDETIRSRIKAESEVQFVYIQDATLLINLRGELQNKLVAIRDASTIEDLNKKVWEEFLPEGTKRPDAAELTHFREALASEQQIAALAKAIERAFAMIEQKGVIDQLEPGGNQFYIQVRYPSDEQGIIPVAEVQRGEAITALKTRLRKEIDSTEVYDRVAIWLEPRLKKLDKTLKYDGEATKFEKEKAVAKVLPEYKTYEPGKTLIKAGKPLEPNDIALLKDEYDATIKALTWEQMVARSFATFGMFVALGGLCSFYVYHRERRLLSSMRRYMLLAAMVMTVAVCLVTTKAGFRAEIIPLLLFGITVAISYQQELALLLSASLALIVTVSLGQGLFDFVTLLSGVATAILLLGNIRNRSKLIYVGLCAGVVVSLTAIGVGILDNQPLGPNLFEAAGYTGLWALFAGFLMLGLLPFIEKLFGVLTDISLLELGDVAHPLLQELVRRAPGTYNHSINVASIAEAAAESIGARGLLVRVGAYFHDIGKMLKPQYFTENQGGETNRHEVLAPAMSTLIIIAHIKDGADLARQHHLPQPITDFIVQHHGTTLVEYFYHRANVQSEFDPNRSTVQESAFRYPGPKPQTKEAGVLMLADCVESACRSLVGPTPARIEGLVHDLLMKRLLDGQFDESGLTLQELHTIQESLVKSLTAVYHGRVKYPDQRTA